MTNLVKMSFVDCKEKIDNFQEYIASLLNGLSEEIVNLNYEIIESQENLISCRVLQNKSLLYYI